MKTIRRREFIKLAGAGSLCYFTCLGHCAEAFGQGNTQEKFSFLQLSDTHVGFSGPAANPEASTTLKRAVDAVNALSPQPDFIVFTGDLTHTTDDGQERRKRLAEFKDIVGGLTQKKLYFLPGEHDAALDNAEAYMEFFGKTHYSFQHKGVNFICLDNVSDPSASLGDAQLAWLSGELGKLTPNDPIVILTHRPLFDLYPAWDWATRDGAKALEMFMPYQNLSVLYGHIHQENHHETGQIGHHAAMSLIFALPAPGSAPKRAPIPWDPAQPFKGLGYVEAEAALVKPSLKLAQRPLGVAKS